MIGDSATLDAALILALVFLIALPMIVERLRAP